MFCRRAGWSRVFTTVEPRGPGTVLFAASLERTSLVAGAEPRTGVVVGVDRSRGDAVRLAGHGDVSVAGHGDALARVDRVLVHRL